MNDPAERVGELLDRAAQAEWDHDTADTRQATDHQTDTNIRREEPQ